jgi:hypothetical protein
MSKTYKDQRKYEQKDEVKLKPLNKKIKAKGRRKTNKKQQINDLLQDDSFVLGI